MDVTTERRQARVALALKAARRHSVDLVTAEVVEALRGAGVRAIVLKGPVFARWLYRDGAFRSYSDSDVLVAPGDAHRAYDVLRGLGFEPLVEASEAYSSSRTPKHARCWARGGIEGDLVDVHSSVAGAMADDDVVWAAIARGAEAMHLGDVEIEATGTAANALIAALHAATNGPSHESSREDLRRALEVTDRETWSAAARLAYEIRAEGSFAAGLRILQAGRALADELELPHPASVDVLLRAGGAPDGAVFLNELSGLTSWRARARLLARGVIPSTSYMRNVYPLAKRGPAGLAAAYLLRALRRLVTAVPAMLALATARRTARNGRSVGAD